MMGRATIWQSEIKTLLMIGGYGITRMRTDLRI